MVQDAQHKKVAYETLYSWELVMESQYLVITVYVLRIQLG